MRKIFTLRKALLLLSLLAGCWAQSQTNPTPLSLPYTQNFNSFTGSTTAYPAGFQGWTVSGSLSTAFTTGGTLTDLPMIATTNTNTSAFVADMNGKMGILSTASNMKAIGMAINTTNFTNIQFSFTAATQRQLGTERVDELAVQYRIGTSGAFTTIAGSTYQNNGTTPNTTGTTAVTPATVSFTLPAACNNQLVVQLRWLIRDVSGAGGRPGYSVDDISVSGTGTTPVTTSLSPSSIAAGSGAFTLTVNGSSFSNQSTVTWNGANRSTSFVSGNQLNAFIPATDIAAQGTAVVGVTTTGAPASSNTQIFTIDAAATPTLLVTSPLADYGSLCTNAAPVVNSFSLSASNLDGTDLVVAAKDGFTYSETVNGTYTSTLHITYTGGGFAGKTVFVKFTPAAVQSYNGNISIAGGNTAGVNVAVTATGINTAASVVTNTNFVTGTSATLTGTLSATGCTNVSSFGFEYSTSPGFVNGTGIAITASGLSGGGFSKTVTGLAASTTYYYKAFAVNGGGTAYGTENTFTTSSVVPVIMSAQPLLRFTENFNDVSAWTANFTAGNGANHFASVAVNAAGTIPSATRISTSSAAFSSGSSGGVQKGSGALVLLSTGATDNSSSVAVDFHMDFTGVNAGVLSFDWTAIANSSGDRKGSLRVYGSTDGISFTELTAADVLNFTNNVPATGTVNSIALPASFSNSPGARLRFYYHNGNGGTTGSRPKISIDNLVVTAVASTPCATPAAAPTALTFGTVAETSISGSFTAASPSANEYLVIMSTSSSLTNNPLDGQTYTIGDNVGDGTVIAKGNELNFTATDLTGATTYYFFVFSVNSVCTGGPKYLTTDVLEDEVTTVAGLPSCTAPAAQPAGLTTTASINSIHGSFTATAADEYIVLQSTSATFSGTFVNGVVYNAGATVGNATVVQRSSATTFNATGLNPETQYYYYIFSINSQACVNGPVYNAESPLTGTATTLPLPVCSTPTAQPSDIAFNSSNNSVTATFNAGGAGYNYLVIMSTSPGLSATPADNTDYSAGTSFGGGTVVSNGTSTSFIATSLSNSTTYYFFVFSANKNCTGGTKYLTTAPLSGTATTTNAPLNNYYFGNLHAHTDYSDGQKDNPGGKPSDAYAYAAASQGMDFLGISEHNHFSTLNNPGNEIANFHSGSVQAATFNQTHPNFLALYGMEWGVIKGGGHVLVYGDGLTELFGWESNVNGSVGPNYDVYVPKSTYLGVEGLFARINDYAAKNAFGSLAHPDNTDYNNLSNIAYDQSADDAISGVAVESGSATSANTTYSNPSTMSYLWYYIKLLSKGYHVGPVIDHDNHNTTFGRHTPARTAVIAPALTQAAIIKAVRDMHFYATEDMDAKVDFTINTRIMGSVFEDRNAPSIAVNLTDATNSTTGALIRVMYGQPGSNVNAVVIDSVFGSSLSFVDNELDNHATGYYYIDILNNGKRIVTAPIWYTRTCASASDTTANVCGSFDWYGTVYTSSTTATKIFTTAGGCDSTVTLHLTISNAPSAATLVADGSGVGCPGTGVTLTASANDGGNGAITSYQWIQDGNIVATTAAGTYTATASGNYTVNIFNAGNCSVTSNAISVTVSDNIAPVADATSLPVITGSCSVTVPSAPTATDNCAGTITGTTGDPLTYTTQGTFTIHWAFNDGNGNTTTQEQTVIVSDTENPTITAPNEVSVVNDAGQCGATISNIGTPVTADNCGVASVTNDHPSAYYPVGTTIVTWKVTDVNGNVTDTATQKVTVIDNELPTITVSDVTVPANAGCGASLVLLTPPTSDNCGVASVTNDHPSVFFPVGNTTITWTVTDNNGWSTTATQIITVKDQQAPTAVAQSVTVYLNAAGTATVTAAQVNNGSTDNCSIATYSLSKTGFNCSNLGTNTVTLTVTDAAGNASSATAIVTVKDNIAPTITTQPITIYLNASGSATITASQLIAAVEDNCGVSASAVSKTNFNCANLGANTVTVSVTDASGNTATATAVVTVKDNTAPVITAVPSQTFCTNGTTYTIPVLTAVDNCSAVITSYTITGATTRSGSTNNASGVFNAGVSTINWTVKDAGGNISTSSTSVTINALPATTITVSHADAFCNKLTLTANTAGAGATYKWTSGSTTIATTQQLNLGQTNTDGIYQVTVTLNGCTSAAATYNYQKQNLISSYTLLAFDKVDLGTNNIVASGSVGVTDSKGEVELGSFSTVSSAGSFVKAKNIDKNGLFISISNPIYAAATGITLPTMLLNTANANNLSNKDVAQNSVSTVSGNYKNLTLKKGSRTTLTGNTFGSIRVEQGAQVTFTAPTISIDKLDVVKGPRNGYSYVRFSSDAKVLVSTSVTIGSQVFINPDNNNVTFYMGDKKSDDERFVVNGGDTKVNANIYIPKGKLKVTGGYRYGDYGFGFGDCDRDDDDERYFGQGTAYVNMTGTFIAENITGNGKNVIWNSFDCSAPPVAVVNATQQVITQSSTNENKTTTTSEEELKVTVLPNPSTTYFSLKIESKYETPVNIRVMDGRGRIVDAKSKVGSNSTIQLGHDYSGGTYFAELIQGGLRKVVQLIKVR
jgi:hypothetical protein